ncbi:hypothetical protein CVT25_009342 [Psilocybe cyanescens]|uniref:Uncharacterized protein n=1 Tax=Psilocybe cyanescens TaxID=93625 RepID=A0A409VNE1_PSICY|nr:hypothetical protein CVT25_009342 [Psilocybe cyanescens]
MTYHMQKNKPFIFISVHSYDHPRIIITTYTEPNTKSRLPTLGEAQYRNIAIAGPERTLGLGGGRRLRSSSLSSQRLIRDSPPQTPHPLFHKQ